MDGDCWLTGGTSTAFIHKVVQSQWSPEQGPPPTTKKSLPDTAWEVVHALESGELTDTEAFLRGVYNDMAYQGLPEEFHPKRIRDQQ